MRLGVLLGVLLIGLGIFTATGRATYSSSRSVLQVGELKATVKEGRAVPTWVGYVGICAGVIVLLGSAGRRRS